MRNYTYDKKFMIKTYPKLVKWGFSDAEILSLYNQYWADEARNTYNWKHHIVSETLFQIGTLEIYYCWDAHPSEEDGLELLQMLSPRQRQIVTLKARGKKQKEIAKRIGISGAAVSKQLAAAQKILHDHFLARHLITE